MSQEMVQTQEQQLVQVQTQRLTAQQVLAVRMLEMPLAQLEEAIQKELLENPGLEANEDHSEMDMYGPADDGDNAEYSDDEVSREEREERRDELDRVLDQLDSDDRMESSNYDRVNNNDSDADKEERIYGNMESFYDKLMEQVGEQSLTERQITIIEYLIGSLDTDGLLRKDLSTLSDEIAIQEYIDASEDEIEKVLTVLQSFDPAGIGAQSLQQCLLIQIFRKASTPVTKLMYKVIADYYPDFVSKKWRKIQDRLKMSDYMAEEVFSEIQHLNPRPGAALGETMGRNIDQVTPDFSIEVDEAGNVTVSLNHGKVPKLSVSYDLEQMIEGYHHNPGSMTRKDKEGLLYAQEKMRRAKIFIEAITQRQKTMLSTMRAIAELQKRYLQSGDESDLRPMILKDVADIAHVDISTVSRVCSSKYAETPYGVMSLKSFFSEGYDTGNGEEISTREIKSALKELVENEPKGKPLSDIKLAAELKKMGYPIARRTVAKYREQMNIPSSNLRK